MIKTYYYLLWILFFLSFSIIFGESITVQIAQSSDDAVQDVLTTTNGDSTTYYCDDSTEPLMGYHISFGNIMLGLRFQNVNIPTNVIIDSVMITFTSGGNTTGTNTFLKINGENQNSPVTFPQATGYCSAYDESWDATSNIVALSLNGSGKMGFGDGIPAIANNAGSGVTGDVLITNASASVGTIILAFRKVSGWDNIT